MLPRRVCTFALPLLIAAGSGAAAGQAPAAPSQAPPPTQTPAPPSTPAPPPPSAGPSKAPPVNPIAISFDASLDHDATDAKGPKVLKYVIEFVPITGQGERKEVDLGKPKPVDGQIVVPLAKMALKPGRYAVSVRARGRTGESPMSWVGPFDIVDPNAPKPKEPEVHDHHDHGTPAKPPASTPPPPPPKTPPPPPANTPAAKEPATAAPAEAASKPAEDKPADGKQKRGFWKKFYEKIVGSP
jgi:hypothetical protein